MVESKENGMDITLERIPEEPEEMPARLEEPKQCSTCPGTIPAGELAWKKQCVDCFRDDRTKRPCEICRKPKIPVTEEAWKKVCHTCFAESPTAKQCEGCKLFVIKACEWRKLCLECYRTKNFKRVCEQCGCRPVDSRQPSYIKTCTRCYLDKKRTTHDRCPTCVGQAAKMLKRRIGHPSCRDCMMANGLITTHQSCLAN